MRMTARLCSFLLAGSLLLSGAAALAQPLTQVQSPISASGRLTALCGESPLGDLAADAVRAAAGADLAIVPGGLLASGLGRGALYEDELSAAFYQDPELGLARLTPAELGALLETGASSVVTGADERIDLSRSAFEGFPQVSGIRWTLDASAPPGERVLSVELNGEPLELSDSDTVLTLAAPLSLLDGSLGYAALEYQPLGTTLTKACSGYLSRLESAEPQDGRLTIIGTASQPLVGRLPVAAVVGACLLIAAVSVPLRRKHDRYFTFRG